MTRIVAAIVAGLLSLPPLQAPNPLELRDRLDAYLTSYQPQLSSLVARESMVQRMEPNDLAATATVRQRLQWPPIVRTLESEVAFVPLPGDAGWMGVRVVRKVDGHTVESPPAALGDLLRAGDSVTAARTLLDASAQHNLGAFRNTNLPNLPLELLHPRHRDHFAYQIQGTETIRREVATRLVGVETMTPSLIRGPDNEPLATRVTAWITPSGQLLRAEARSRVAAVIGKQDEPLIRVDFIHNRTLDLLVPSEMHERFTTGIKGLMGTSVARYSEFRRFQTSARIVPQQ